MISVKHAGDGQARYCLAGSSQVADKGTPVETQTVLRSPRESRLTPPPRSMRHTLEWGMILRMGTLPMGPSLDSCGQKASGEAQDQCNPADKSCEPRV